MQCDLNLNNSAGGFIMNQFSFSTLISGYDFLEGPRWHDGRLWVSDFYTHKVIAVDMEGRVEIMARVEQQPSGLGWLPDGRLLVVSMGDKKVLRREPNGSLVVHADLSGIAGGPCNDMVVDRAGRAYVGNFGFEMSGGRLRTASLARVEPDGKVYEAASDLYFPNGAMITHDGRTLLVNETFGNRVSAFDILPNGTLGPRRDWASFGPLPEGDDFKTLIPQLKVAPDGGALDAEGNLWIADAIGKRALRVEAGGRVLEKISTGDMGVFACMLGGPDRRTLFLCVAPDSSGHHRQGAGQAAVWFLDVKVPGAGHP